MREPKKAPKRGARRTVHVGRAAVSWGPQMYGRPSVIATALVEDIDDLVACVLQAQWEIRAGFGVACTDNQPQEGSDE